MATAAEPRNKITPWQPEQLQKFARSLSKDNLTLVPLHRVSSTFQDVKKNGEALMVTAQNAVQRFRPDAQADEWTLLGRLGQSEMARPSLRKSASEANLCRPRLSHTMTTKVHAGAPAPQPEAFHWLGTFNEKINKARDSNRPKFQLPSGISFESQAKQLMGNASGVNLERVASHLMGKPREALFTAQQTLTNCQQNLQALQLTIQQSFSEGRATFEQRLGALGEPGTPSSSGQRLTSLLSPPWPGRGKSTGAEGEETSNPSESIQALPAYLQSLVRRGSVEPLRDDGRDSDSCEDARDVSELNGPSSSTQPWGPFQQQAHRRKTEHRSPSSLRDDGRNVTIVTTASLPWMTGTAVNPLLRAAYLARDEGRSVTLMIPWLSKPDQERVYPSNVTFDTPEQQESYVRDWVQQRTGFSSNFNVTFYPGRYAPEKCSILPVGDPTAYVPDSAADVAILEEPEHLTWYHHGRRWTDKFAHVVGVVHTNYLDYARREEGGSTKEILLRHINNWVTRIHCHKVIKLSDAVQDLPRQTTQFVHGVAESFLRVGEKKATMPPGGGQRFSRGAYFLGKCVWAKGYTELLDLLTRQNALDVPVDCYGAGEDLDAVRTEAARRHLALKFHGARDHLDESIHEYRVFVNPSTSDVVATTTAEALAMGKWVVCADHPSNRFFSQFKNCLIYRTPEEFEAHLRHALSVDPEPITAEDKTRLTWEAATERFLDVAELTSRDLEITSGLAAAADGVAWLTHNTLCGVEPLRQVAGAGANTRNNPQSITDYQPSAADLGGLFDDRRRAVKAYTGRGAGADAGVRI